VGIVKELVEIWPNEVCDTTGDKIYGKMKTSERNSHVSCSGIED